LRYARHPGAAHVDAAEARNELLRVAARDREADALVGDAPDARRQLQC
jgi:hypothetical protein